MVIKAFIKALLYDEIRNDTIRDGSLFYLLAEDVKRITVKLKKLLDYEQARELES